MKSKVFFADFHTIAYGDGVTVKLRNLIKNPVPAIRINIVTENPASIPTSAIEWKACLEHAEKIGIGNREYELIK